MRTTVDHIVEPATWEEIETLGENERSKWIAAQDEMNSLVEKDFCELCNLLEGKEVIDTKWVFKVKQDKDENITR